MIIGLTGGIGSGKSFVSQAFAEKGVRIIDADEIARQIVKPGQTVLRQLSESFGTDIIDAHGILNRALLRERAFANEQNRMTLNAITHPVIRSKIISQITMVKQKNEVSYRILSAPLLLENGLSELVELVIVVDLSESLQIERVSLRDHTDFQDVLRIMHSQWPRIRRLASANVVIDNHGSRENTLLQVEVLHKQISILTERIN